MKGKIVIAALALLLAAASMSPAAFAQNAPVTTGKAQSPADVYDSLDKFQMGIEKLQGSQAGEHMDDAAKQARREAISTALAAVKKNDRAAMQAVASRFGLAIYDPNLNNVSISSYEQDVRMASPRVTWDSISKEYGFWGTAEWVNGSAIYNDWQLFSNGNLGGPDGYGLIFTSIADDAKITSSYVQQWDSRGTYMGLYSTKSFIPKSLPGPYAFTIRVQDTWRGLANGYCSCWKSEIWAWMKPEAMGSGLRNAYTYYAHDYKDTQLTGMELSLDGSIGPNEKKVGGSFKLVWTVATEKWAAESAPPTSY